MYLASNEQMERTDRFLGHGPDFHQYEYIASILSQHGVGNKLCIYLKHLSFSASFASLIEPLTFCRSPCLLLHKCDFHHKLC
jgi:hypothetical protein